VWLFPPPEDKAAQPPPDKETDNVALQQNPRLKPELRDSLSTATAEPLPSSSSSVKTPVARRKGLVIRVCFLAAIMAILLGHWSSTKHWMQALVWRMERLLPVRARSVARAVWHRRWLIELLLFARYLVQLKRIADR
jgi:hypothetical protein